ncbi:putative viral capsid [Circoviridae 8 LDMD-2013]|uniref:putative viral capsid n=1 Tax=Circoviridae 8 LDMD-2013 TaxID=1379712 RepID=UPI000384582E|nr:putative viral capsid [Circoviridae 8 LDMD-2013]AGS36203.1 putative viral capsid [Circoviridae 8 LDMD-2013]
MGKRKSRSRQTSISKYVRRRRTNFSQTPQPPPLYHRSKWKYAGNMWVRKNKGEIHFDRYGYPLPSAVNREEYKDWKAPYYPWDEKWKTTSYTNAGYAWGTPIYDDQRLMGHKVRRRDGLYEELPADWVLPPTTRPTMTRLQNTLFDKTYHPYRYGYTRALDWARRHRIAVWIIKRIWWGFVLKNGIYPTEDFLQRQVEKFKRYMQGKVSSSEADPVVKNPPQRPIHPSQRPSKIRSRIKANYY